MLILETVYRQQLQVMGYNPVSSASGAGWKPTETVQGLPASEFRELRPCNSWNAVSVVLG